MSWRRLIHGLMPLSLRRNLRNRAPGSRQVHEWEFIPEGWAYAQEHPEVKGWDVPDIVAVYKSRWLQFAGHVQSPGPLSINHEAQTIFAESASYHNLVMTYAYVLALAARHKDRIRMLDWGGGIGHYYLLAQSLLPGVEFDYHCRDLPQMCSYGHQLFPEQSFFSDDRWHANCYDLVMASSSLHYAEDWPEQLRDLCSVTHDLLFVTNLPIVRRVPSFVFIQRPYRHGYNTEYLGWCINEHELVQTAAVAGLSQVRQFLYGFSPVIAGAPEQNVYRGYLFQRHTKFVGVSR